MSLVAKHRNSCGNVLHSLNVLLLQLKKSRFVEHNPFNASFRLHFFCQCFVIFVCMAERKL